MLLGAFLFLAPNFAFATLGISPPSVVVNDITREYGQVVTVNILRNEGPTAETFAVEFQGQDARFLEGPDMITFPQGVTIVPYQFSILPKEAAIGSYNAKVLFLPQTGEGGVDKGAGTILRRGVQLMLDFSVSDKQVIDFDITNVNFPQTEELLSIILGFQVVNNGNTEWRPDEITVSFFDAGSGNLITTETFDGKKIGPWRPGETRSELVDFESKLPAGQYKGEIKFLVGGEVVFATTEDLQVFSPGTLKQSGELSSFSASKDSYAPNEQVVMLGTFRNTGTIPVLSRMIIEIYSADDQLLDTLVGKSFSVGRDEITTFRSFTEFSNEGDYKMVGYVEFGNKVSNTQNLNVNVTAKSLAVAEVLPADKWGYIWTLLISLIVLLAFGILWFFFRKRKQVEPPVVNSPIFSNSPVITGTCSGKVGSVINIYANKVIIGTTKLEGVAWQFVPASNTLTVGTWITATVTIDSNQDGTISDKDRTSAQSEGVTVEANPLGSASFGTTQIPASPSPLQPQIPQVTTPVQTPVQTPITKTNPVKNILETTDVKISTDAKKIPDSVTEESINDSKPDDLWTISL